MDLGPQPKPPKSKLKSVDMESNSDIKTMCSSCVIDNLQLIR